MIEVRDAIDLSELPGNRQNPSVTDNYRKSAIEPSTRDWPSYLYLGLFVLNSLGIAGLSQFDSSFVWLPLVPMVMIQGGFFIGMLELTHQSVHYNFILNRKVNEWVGSLAAALIGFNLTAYRYFHLEHHRHTCDARDPEGLLYAESPTTRWSALGAPIAHAWVAWHINALASRYVPQRKHAALMQARAMLIFIMSSLGFIAIIAPKVFLLAYLLPVCLFTWVDFFFSQAEHYDAPIRATHEAIDVSMVTYDIPLPTALSHLMLNRNLHSVHHVWPRTRWFEAPARLTTLYGAAGHRTLSPGQFLRCWMAGGPRLWPDVSHTPGPENHPS